ncbi:hypothetical protein [Mesorhizobium amorphae]|uniref:hypothetical protein n=1 Tax=Mesorhizobium amorphae TaxID=71433 RepID=UPI001642A236|nr:hypothetical protein [Mesorhizobium amorphae]
MIEMDFFEETKADIDCTERSFQRTASMMLIFCIVWVLFLMGAITAGLFIIGRWTGVW